MGHLQPFAQVPGIIQEGSKEGSKGPEVVDDDMDQRFQAVDTRTDGG